MYTENCSATTSKGMTQIALWCKSPGITKIDFISIVVRSAFRVPLPIFCELFFSFVVDVLQAYPLGSRVLIIRHGQTRSGHH
jgi:hypothetical protein